jgi:hypothetical protein
MIRFAYIFVFLICSFFTTVHSQVTITIPSITVERNENFIVQVPVSFEEGFVIDSFSFIVEFNPQVVSLQRTTTPLASAILCDTLKQDSLYIPPDRMQVRISCNAPSVGAANQNILLHFLALSGKDSTTKVDLLTIQLNGANVPISNPSNGLITIRNNKQVVQNFPEFLGQNFPNPVERLTTFPYSINNVTNVTFSVYNSVGEKILTFPTIQRDRGGYNFILGMDPTEFASGTYCLQMETNENVYFQSFLYLK